MIETNRPKCNADNIRTGVPVHTHYESTYTNNKL